MKNWGARKIRDIDAYVKIKNDPMSYLISFICGFFTPELQKIPIMSPLLFGSINTYVAPDDHKKMNFAAYTSGYFAQYMIKKYIPQTAAVRHSSWMLSVGAVIYQGLKLNMKK